MVFVYDETEEEEVPQFVEGGKIVKTVQIKQPNKVDETIWSEIPQRGLYYTLKNVSITINKLFYYENEKKTSFTIKFF